jgi:hypothetical protein
MKVIITTLIVTFSLPCFAEIVQSNRTNPETGAKTWEVATDGVHFSLTQILPEQLEAFYVNRGFTLKQIEPYISSCVYMTVLRNDNAPGAIHYISNEWTVLAGGNVHQLVSVDDWVRRWEKSGIKKPAIVAFRWAQFPPEQVYQPGGDWNQGMLSVGLAPGSQFDIKAHWDINGKAYESILKGVQCAK